MKESSVRIRIGSRSYSIASSDHYLRQMRPGIGRKTEAALKSIFGGNSFEPRLVGLLDTLIVTPNAIALDIGSNIGCTAIFLSQTCQSVVAFEPIPETFALLEKNLRTNDIQNVVPKFFALGDRQMSATAMYSEENRSGAFIGKRVDGAAFDSEGHATVEVRRLDDIWADLDLARLDFMKIDVEGYELSVLRGAEVTLKHFKPIVEMECNSWCLNVMQRMALPDFVDAILDVFPEVYAVEGDRYIDLHSSKRWQFFEQNVLNQRFREIVSGHRDGRLSRFLSAYESI